MSGTITLQTVADESSAGEAPLADRYLELMYRSVPVGAMTVGLDMRITSWTAGAEKLFGFRADEVLGKKCSDVWRCTACAAGCRLLNESVPKPVCGVECKISAKSRELTVLKSVDVIRGEGGRIIGGIEIFEDITERRRGERRLAELNKNLEETVAKLRRSNDELVSFTHVLAHDLKAPLRAVGTLAEWIVADYGNKLDGDGREKMQLLQSRTRRLYEMVDAVIEYSEVGRYTETPIKIDLNVIICEVIEQVTPPQGIVVAVDKQLPVILGPERSVFKVFRNLISNAVKYMDKPQGRVVIGCTEENDFLKFWVSDDGPGIDEKYFTKLFKVFQTLAPRDAIESVGIGLATVKKTVESWGGRVWVESKPGQGSTFFFTVPRNEMGVTNAES